MVKCENRIMVVKTKDRVNGVVGFFHVIFMIQSSFPTTSLPLLPRDDVIVQATLNTQTEIKLFQILI